jgi:hypothetical protein
VIGSTTLHRRTARSEHLRRAFEHHLKRYKRVFMSARTCGARKPGSAR